MAKEIRLPVRGGPRRPLAALLMIALTATLSACGVSPEKVTVPVVEKVDLQRFMGPWYVIGVIPTFIEKDIYNAIETYELAPDGTIKTTFTFNKGAFDGEAKVMNPKGFVIPGTNNAIWGMQFVWPIKAEYVISHVDAGYTETIIARSARIEAASLEGDREGFLAFTQEAYDLGRAVQRSIEGCARDQQRLSEMSAEALSARLAPGAASSAPLVLDVRRTEEFAAGRVPGSRNLPHDRLVADPALLDAPKDAEIVVYCQSGRRANMALEALQKAGYTRLVHLEGDFPGWQSQGRPVEKTAL
ncbi:MAG: lipocalin family protein [Proteobacteria bacterium]|nr:lipocalin family protein [Pseudomonadota bacterium]